jgi:SAM-dependent methyltransferase
MRKDIENISRVYASAIATKGVTPRGVLWPNAADLATRYEVLLGPIVFDRYSSERPLKLLDFGCGPGFLLDFLAGNSLIDLVDYTGVDVNETTMKPAQKRWPTHRFELREVRDLPLPENGFDYCISCGVFTARFDNSYDEMRRFAEETLQAIWPSVKIGLGFNVMSKHVDWERDDLFHWPIDDVMAFCKSRLSRHVSFRLDYGLWEMSALVLKEPIARQTRVPESWMSGESDAFPESHVTGLE